MNKYIVNTAVTLCAIVLFIVTRNATSQEVNDGNGNDPDFQIAPVTSSPRLSSDGTRVVYSTTANEFGDSDIGVATVEGAELFRFVFPDSEEVEPDWITEETIILSSDYGSQNSDLWTLNLSLGTLTEFYSSEGNDSYPRISPDGNSVLFVSDQTGKNEIWIIGIDGADAKPVALNSILVSDPSWSPDGQYMVFTGCTKNWCNIFTANIEGFDFRQLTEGDYFDWNPVWCSSSIIFASNRNAERTLWRIGEDGTDIRAMNEATSGSATPACGNEADMFYSIFGTNGSEPAANIWKLDSNDKATQITNIELSNNLCSFGLDPTIYVEGGIIVGGPDDGKTYNGLIKGTNNDDVIAGTGGNDRVNAGQGNDTICGYDGDDIIHGGKGDDLIFGGGDNDQLHGQDNNDEIHGGPGNDKIFGGNDLDYLYGDGGDDSLLGQNHDDVLEGGDGYDRCIGEIVVECEE